MTRRAHIDALRRHVRMLAEEIGERNVFCPAALRAAASYIEQEWRRQGYEVVQQSYAALGVECANLEITRPGSDQEAGILLLGAHYDSVEGSPGANDNGSAVAALLELSRLLATARPRREIRFVAFVNEEPPFYYKSDMGSMVYARAAKQRGDDIRLMISLETIGYYDQEPGSQSYPPVFRFFYSDRGNFLAFVTRLRCRSWLRRAEGAFREASDFPTESIAAFSFVPGVGWSDHLSFWRHGYPALMVTDTAPYRYPWYHTAEDTPDKVDFEKLTQVTDGLSGMVERLAGV